MITVIHGDDIVSSRKYFLSEKQKYENSILYDAKSISEQDLIETLEAKDLFSEHTRIFIENLLLAKNKNFINLLKDARSIDIFLWEGKEVSSSELLNLKAKSKFFKLPQSVFLFLDGIKPKTTQNVLFFRNALTNSSEDMIFYMMLRQFRLLLAVSDGGNSIDEVKRLAPWQRNKLQRQASFFSETDLKKIHNKLYKIDLGIKTGEVSSLASSIDFLLLDI